MQRWGIGIPPSLSMKAIVSLAQEAEKAGAESVWVPDVGRDIFTMLTMVAQGTSRVRVGSAVAICFARPPALVQLAASDIDEISDGRMVLGIGTAPSNWNENWYSVPKYEKPVARVREFAEVCRLMWHSNPQNPVEFNGRAIQIHGYSRFYPPLRERIPIHFGGMNPQILRTTGEVADGWLGGGLTSPRFVSEIIRAYVRAGAAKAGRQEGDIEFVCPISCAISPNREQARAWARSHIAFYANVTYYDIVMALHGFQKETRAIRDAFARGDRTAAAQEVTDAMIDTFMLAGTEDECRSRVKAWAGCADVLSFRHTYFDPTIPREALPVAYQALFRLARLL